MGVWYRAGTVAVTNGSKTVTGTGTQWQNLIFGVAPGTTFYGPDGKPYEVDTVNSNTSLTLVTNYSGTTASGQAYAIDPTRSGSVASLAAQTSEVLKFSQGQFTQIQNWFTGAASADVTLTSPAGQQITVPSYSKVTSEGEGQAARAKTEADKAAASAALAGGIVSASALPLPDVWAPLSDSLRMITGYGRDVLVGSDVVARMVNFARSSTATYIGKDGLLKTAAVNEPRFEKEGLLIEGQSTNLVPNSKNPPPTTSETSVTLVASPYGDVFKFAAATTNNSMKDVRFAPLTAGQLVTLSFIAKKAEIDIVAVGFDGMFSALFNLTSVSVGGVPAGSSATITPIGDGFYRATLTTTTTRDVTPSLRLKVNGTFVADAVGDGMLIGNIQAELLPFASSYIPTNGAAVTRAADVLLLDGINMPIGVKTFAVNFTCTVNAATLAGMSIFREDVYSVSNRQTLAITPAGKLSLNDGDGAIDSVALVTSKNQQIAAAVFNGPSSKLALNGIVSKTQRVPITANNRVYQQAWRIGDNAAYPSSIYGHVRNLRVWLRALTDDQLKAVA